MPSESDRQAAERLRSELAERGLAAPPDEIEEIAAAWPALSSWVQRVERLGKGWPAGSGPLPG